MGVLRKACGKNVEFVFLDAPVLLQPADLPQSFASVEALDTVKAPPEEPELQPRAWWRANLDRTVYYHVPETIEYLKNYLKDQRFNLEQPEAYPAILVDGKPPHPPLYAYPDSTRKHTNSSPSDFCVLVSGFKPVDDNLGRNDAIVIPERGRTLVDVSKDPRVEEHEGGHFVPSKANWRNFFKDYFLSFDPVLGGKPVPSPGPAGDTPAQTPGSGTPAEISRVGTPSKI
ncbi:Serine hydrolase (FSH1) [Rhizoctonia solani]|uniref:Serine hydrolase (FSH1) n=1 Tax=Rhizoctonia solani TaxID=456999 RepID=A0A8H7IEM2_9AGAM|nr:Serine hydrolase (FSH1) [Rhizoctonia solani]